MLMVYQPVQMLVHQPTAYLTYWWHVHQHDWSPGRVQTAGMSHTLTSACEGRRRGGEEGRREWKIPGIRWLLAHGVYLSRDSNYRWHLLPTLSFLCDGDLLPGLCVCVCGPITCGWRGESRGNQPWHIDTTTHPWSNTSLQSRATEMTQSIIKRGPSWYSGVQVMYQCWSKRVELHFGWQLVPEALAKLPRTPLCPHSADKEERLCTLVLMVTYVQALCNSWQGIVCHRVWKWSLHSVILGDSTIYTLSFKPFWTREQLLLVESLQNKGWFQK